MSFICDCPHEMADYLKRKSNLPPREKTQYRGRVDTGLKDRERGLDKEERLSVEGDETEEEPRLNVPFPYKVIGFDPEFFRIPANPPTEF